MGQARVASLSSERCSPESLRVDGGRGEEERGNLGFLRCEVMFGEVVPVASMTAASPAGKVLDVLFRKDLRNSCSA